MLVLIVGVIGFELAEGLVLIIRILINVVEVKGIEMTELPVRVI